MSFTVACALSGAISHGERAVLLVIRPNHIHDVVSGAIQIGPGTSLNTYEGPESVFQAMVACHGVYDGYGSLTDVTEGGAALVYAQALGLETVQALVGALGRNGPDGPDAVIDPAAVTLLGDFRKEPLEHLVSLGFLETDSGRWVHPDCPDHSVLVVPHGAPDPGICSAITSRLNGSKPGLWRGPSYAIMEGDTLQSSSTISVGFPDDWYAQTGIHLGYGTDEQKRAWILSQLSGTWIRESIWDFLAGPSIKDRNCYDAAYDEMLVTLADLPADPANWMFRGAVTRFLGSSDEWMFQQSLFGALHLPDVRAELVGIRRVISQFWLVGRAVMPGGATSSNPDDAWGAHLLARQIMEGSTSRLVAEYGPDGSDGSYIPDDPFVGRSVKILYQLPDGCYVEDERGDRGYIDVKSIVCDAVPHGILDWNPISRIWTPSPG